MNLSRKNLEKKTRSVFHDIHLEHLKNKSSMDRLRNLLATETLNLPKDFFLDKVCGDLGCGSAVHGAVNLLTLSAKYVYALDLDESFIEPAKKTLEEKTEFANRWQLDVGSMLDLPYADEQLDFILCQGAIHHCADDQKAVKEIHRVLKSGGKAYLNVCGKGGIITRFFMEVLRDEYQNNGFLRNIADKDFNDEWLKKQIDCLINHIEDDGSSSYRDCKSFLSCLKKLVDKDLILSLKDTLHAPTYNMYTEKDFVALLKTAGFSSWYRVVKKVNYYNIRKIFSPFYYDYKHPLARLFYNDGGALNFVVTK